MESLEGFGNDLESKVFEFCKWFYYLKKWEKKRRRKI